MFLKKVLETIGLQVQKWKAVKGVTALEEYIKKNPNQYVKLNIFRGDQGAESFYAKDIESIQIKLLRLRLTYGPLAEEVVFIVEENIDTPVEIGYDGFFNGKNYADKYDELISVLEYEQQIENIGIYRHKFAEIMNEFENSSVEVQYKIRLFSLLKQNILQSNTIIRKYIVLADYAIVTTMKYRLLFHYTDEMIHQYSMLIC